MTSRNSFSLHRNRNQEVGEGDQGRRRLTEKQRGGTSLTARLVLITGAVASVRAGERVRWAVAFAPRRRQFAVDTETQTRYGRWRIVRDAGGIGGGSHPRRDRQRGGGVAMVMACQTAFGRIDILNNVGGSAPGACSGIERGSLNGQLDS